MINMDLVQLKIQKDNLTIKYIKIIRHLIFPYLWVL